MFSRAKYWFEREIRGEVASPSLKIQFYRYFARVLEVSEREDLGNFFFLLFLFIFPLPISSFLLICTSTMGGNRRYDSLLSVEPILLLIQNVLPHGLNIWLPLKNRASNSPETWGSSSYLLLHFLSKLLSLDGAILFIGSYASPPLLVPSPVKTASQLSPSVAVSTLAKEWGQ